MKTEYVKQNQPAKLDDAMPSQMMSPRISEMKVREKRKRRWKRMKCVTEGKAASRPRKRSHAVV